MSSNGLETSSKNSQIIAGIDILPGSSSASGFKSRYALAIYSKGGFTRLEERLSLNEIIRILRKNIPQIIATDNIFEIIPRNDRIHNFLLRIPAGTKLVQVTGSPHHYMNPVNKLAEKIGLKIKGKLSPLETAKIVALLAAKKIGFEIIAFENETTISITRSRSLGPGGSSQARLRRRLHSFILNNTREVENILKENNLEYELLKRESDFGLDQSKFTVNANEYQLRKLIKEIKGPDIKIIIRPIEKENIVYKPLSDDAKIYGTGIKLIVGVDPGITTGIAIMNLNGKILDLKSRKTFSKSKIIDHVYHFGEPLILASDTNPPSNFIIKLAKTTKSKLYFPRKVLTIAEKQETVNEYIKNQPVKITNSHKRDALSAAIKAFQNYQPLFNKVETRLKAIPEYVPINEIKADVLLYEKSITQSITDYLRKNKKRTEKQKPAEESETVKELTEDQYTIRELHKKISNITDYANQLKKDNENLKKEFSELQLQFKKALNQETIKTRKDRIFELKEQEIYLLKNQINKLKAVVSTLENDIEKLKKIKILEAQGKIIPVKIVKTFSKEGLIETEDKYGLLNGDILYFEDAGGGGKGTAEKIIEKGIKAVITSNEMSHLALETLILGEIPVIPENFVNLNKFNQFYAVDKSKFDDIYSQFMEKIKQDKDSLNAIKINEIIEEYQRKRKEQKFIT